MTTKRTATAKKVEAVEVTEEVKKPKAVKKPAEPFFVQDGQTEVSSRRQINFFPNTKRVTVENLGGGELYVGTTNIDFIEENLVRIGEVKEITDVTAFYVGASSRPFFRISHFE
ncbi:hypothetical protein ACPA0F_18260 [Solibacillus silvestris]